MKDFHIHYHLDECGAEEMTMANIERACIDLGIDEGCVLKHYSMKLPNGERDWVCWHVQGTKELDKFLSEYRAYTPEKVKFHCGVETELLNDKGDINIPVEDQNKVDMVQLSVHFMIDTEKLPMDMVMYPNSYFCPEYKTEAGQKIWSEWKEKVNTVGAEYLIEATAKGYYNALTRFPQIKSLSHMGDGIAHLYTYGADVEAVPMKKRVEIFEPLMKLMSEKGIFWEVTSGGMSQEMFDRARELGVIFTCTADGHQLYEGWGPLCDHIKAEEALKKLNEGRITGI